MSESDIIFRATNGVMIRIDGDDFPRLVFRAEHLPGGPLWWHPVGQRLEGSNAHGFTTTSALGIALSEYFQHRRDEELNRWRWPENPDYVVYPIDNDAVDVLRERSVSGKNLGPGRQQGITREQASTLDGDYSQLFFEAAHAYFDEHPAEPSKPWLKAVYGEAWELTVDGQTEVFVVNRPDLDSGLVSGTRMLAAFDHSITAGRRIYPLEGEGS